MKKSDLKVTKVNARDCELAEKALLAFYEKTKKYESTKQSLDKACGTLRVLVKFYTAAYGYVLTTTPNPKEQIFKMPYHSKTLKATFGDAKMLYAFASNNKTKGEKIKESFAVVAKVFDLAILRAEYMEGVKIV